MTLEELIAKVQLGRKIIEQFNNNTRNIDLVNADLVIIFKQFDEWNKQDNITIEQAELGKRYIGKILMNIKEAKKLSDDGIRLREEALAYAVNQVDKDKITEAPKIDWSLYLKNYTEMYNDVDKIIKEYRKVGNEGEEWKQ